MPSPRLRAESRSIATARAGGTRAACVWVRSFALRSEEVAALAVAMPIFVASLETDVERRLREVVGRNRESDRHGQYVARRRVDRRGTFDLRQRIAGARGHGQRERQRLLRLVDDSQRVIVANRVAICVEELA